MKVLIWAMAAGLSVSAVQGSDVTIEAFGNAGRLAFTTVSNATGYRVEWCSDLRAAAWTNFAAAAGRLDHIVATPGVHSVTCSVPVFYRVIATVTNPPLPDPFIFVEGGTFAMGDAWGDGEPRELPVHTVTVSSVWVSMYELTNDELADVFNWAWGQGKLNVNDSVVSNAVGQSQPLLNLYHDLCQISWNGSSFVADSGKGNHPAVQVTWYGALAYCVFRSQREGRPVCYDLSDWRCNWNSGGYRLPTEAEWEYAARGGTNGNGTKYSGSDNADDVAWHINNSGPLGHEVGTKAPNELGLFDMSGNAYEWCWDWYGEDYYSSHPVGEWPADPRGPASGDMRIQRGGGWSFPPRPCSFRGAAPPYSGSGDRGIRLVVSP